MKILKEIDGAILTMDGDSIFSWLAPNWVETHHFTKEAFKKAKTAGKRNMKARFYDENAPIPKERASYAEKRANEYHSVGDQLDAIMKWLATETEFNVPDELKSMAMHAMSVKAKHPKPRKGPKK